MNCNTTVKFIHSDNSVRIVTIDLSTTKNKVSPAVYTMCFDNVKNEFYLKRVSSTFQIPDKIYGDTVNLHEKLYQAYSIKRSSVGILFTGLKGTGKTLVSQLLGNLMIENGFPVILIEAAFSGELFNSFMNSIGECFVIIDEVAKVYGQGGSRTGKQQELLTFLDGVARTKRLVMLMENDVGDINEFLLNRPGRILYHYKYKKLGESVTRGYLHDMGVDGDTIETFCRTTENMEVYSFDVLQAMYFEWANFGKPKDLKSMIENLNVCNVSSAKVYLTYLKLTRNDDKTLENEKMFIKLNSTPILWDGYYEVVIPTQCKSSETCAASSDIDELVYNEEYFSESFEFFESHVKFTDHSRMVFMNDMYTLVCAKETRDFGLRNWSELAHITHTFY